ncbi:Polysaccharide biosynthesis protein [Flavobacterium daejeonense]|nr:Polysaccharide biosynthesis protein [Flavobacterium daejeonense]
MSSIRKNFVYNILLSVTQVLFPLITFSYVARIIQPDGVGTVSFVESICRYAILIAALGIPIYGVREVAKCKEDKIKLNQLFNELVIIHLLTTIFTILVYILMVFNIDKFYQNISFYILGIAMILSNVFVIEWYFQGIGDFKFITIRTLVIRTITTISVFFLVKNSQDSIYFFLLAVLTNVLNGIINFWYAQKTIELNFNVELVRLKKHLIPLFYIFSTTLSISIYVLLDTIMLGFLSSENAVGFYSMALRISKIPMLFVGALGTVLIPQLAYSYGQNNLEEFKKLISKSVIFVISFSIPIIFLLLGVSKNLIVVFAGSEFAEATMTLQILSVVVLLIGMSNIFGLQILTPMGKDKYLTISVVMGTITSVVLNFFLIPLFQEVGAAISNIITECLVTAATFYFSSKFIKLNLDYIFILKTLVLCVPIYFLPKSLYYLTTDNLLILVGTVLVTAIYYLGLQLYVLKNEIIIELYSKLKLKLWPNTII